MADDADNQLGDDIEYAQDIFNEKYASRTSFTDMMIGSGMAFMSKEDRDHHGAINDYYRPDYNRILTEDIEKQKVETHTDNPKRKTKQTGAWVKLLRFIDWLNSLFLLPPDISESEGEGMGSLSDFFYEDETEEIRSVYPLSGTFYYDGGSTIYKEGNENV